MKLLITGGVVLSALAAAQLLGLRVNTSASMPVGLWHVAPLSAEPRRGEIVTACPPDTAVTREAAARGYLPTGSCSGRYEPLVKRIAAVPGDVVTVARAGISVNGELVAGTAQLDQDSAGRALQGVPAGVYQVSPARVWLLSGHDPHSWDSRYFGAVPVENVQTTARPVWVR